MKTFEGNQLKYRKANNVPISGIKFNELLFKVAKIIIIELQIKPSMPSIKFIELIINDPKNIKIINEQIIFIIIFVYKSWSGSFK